MFRYLRGDYERNRASFACTLRNRADFGFALHAKRMRSYRQREILSPPGDRLDGWQAAVWLIETKSD